MPDEIDIFNVEAKVGLGKCGSLPAFEEFVKLSGMNSFASQTVKVETEVAVDLQSTTEETKFVLIQPIATTENGTVWTALDPGVPVHDDLAKALSFTNDLFTEQVFFGRILIFYDGLASSIAGSPITLALKDTDSKFKGVMVRIITAGSIPKPISNPPKNAPKPQDVVVKKS